MPVTRRLIIRLFGRRQPGGFPRFEASGHGANVFIAHFLQALASERGAAAAAAMANDHCVRIGNFFFDVEFDGAAAYVKRAGDVAVVPFIFVADINDYRLAAAQLRGGFRRWGLGDVSLRNCD